MQTVIAAVVCWVHADIVHKLVSFARDYSYTLGQQNDNSSRLFQSENLEKLEQIKD